MTRAEAHSSFYCIEAGTDGIELVNEIYDDFKSRTCENCKQLEAFDYCPALENCIAEPQVFGCNKFEPGEQ